MLSIDFLYIYSQKTIRQICHRAGIWGYTHQFCPSASAKACFFQQFPLCSIEGCFALLYHTCHKFEACLPDTMTILTDKNEIVILRNSNNVYPIGVFQHIILRMYFPIW